MAYDNNNVFAKILRGEIPCQKILETEFSLAFNDIAPQSPTHILVIPKGAYVDFQDFSANASDVEITDYIRTIGLIAKEAGVETNGYRLIANIGEHSGQEVPHLHFHICGGRPLGVMLQK